MAIGNKQFSVGCAIAFNRSFDQANGGHLTSRNQKISKTIRK